MKRILFIAALCVAVCGCARFRTTQTDISYDCEGNITRKITTDVSAGTLGTSKSSLTKFKASQTDKTQGAEVGALAQSTEGTNIVETIKATTALIKAIHGQ